MHIQLLALIALTPLVTAHAKIPILHGNHGGNASALGILGGIIPSLGANSDVEVDGTIFSKQDPATDGLGRTPKNGAIKPEDLQAVLDMSGGRLPLIGVGVDRQGNEELGWLMGRWRVISSDGAGPISAIVDPTATGKFANGINATVSLQVPGKFGRIWPNGTVPRSIDDVPSSNPVPVKRSLSHLFRRVLGGDVEERDVHINKRAPRTDLEFPFRVSVPKDVVCKGEVAGQKGVCFLKLANSHRNGPFGGVVAFQVKKKEEKRGKEFIA